MREELERVDAEVEGRESKFHAELSAHPSGNILGPHYLPPTHFYSATSINVLACTLRAPALTTLSVKQRLSSFALSQTMSRDSLTAVDLFTVRRGGLDSQDWDHLIQSQARSSIFTAFLDHGAVTFPSIHFDRLPYNITPIQESIQKMQDIHLAEAAEPSLTHFPFISPCTEDSYPYAIIKSELRQRQQLLKPGMQPPPVSEELVARYHLVHPGSYFTFGVPHHIAFKRFELRCCMRCGSPACDSGNTCRLTFEYVTRIVRSLYDGDDHPVRAISLTSKPFDRLLSRLNYLSCLPGTLFLLEMDDEVKRRREDMRVCVVCGLDHWEWSQEECALWRRFQAAQWSADIDQWTECRQRVLRTNTLYRRMAGNGGDVEMDSED